MKFNVATADQRGAPIRCSICGELGPVVHLPMTRKDGEGGTWVGICGGCLEGMRRALIVGALS